MGVKVSVFNPTSIRDFVKGLVVREKNDTAVGGVLSREMIALLNSQNIEKVSQAGAIVVVVPKFRESKKTRIRNHLM